jgi:3-deoxy-D-manno-octulosonic-acid transferase
MDRPSPSVEAPAEGRVLAGAYRTLWSALSPAVPLLLKARAARGKEDPARLSERRGDASRTRPQGTLIWIHGASVGECLAALPLVARLLERENRHVLVTSGTVTSARLMAERLPARALHQYVPLDSPVFVRRFLDHWRPDLALFIESELWPNLIQEAQARKIPMALANARLSETSFRGWRRAPGLARRLLSAFDICLAQDAAVAQRLRNLGARAVEIAGSLKADAPPLPVDETALAAFRAALGTRPLFLAASTHPGEEDVVLEVARMNRGSHDDLLTVIVPRHPARGKAIAELATRHGFAMAQRSTGALPGPATSVYVADTLGELGLFYSAAPFAFLGGSLVRHGGQNPLEAARLGTAVVTGPYTDNFAGIFEVLLAAQGDGLVRSKADLFRLTSRLIAQPAYAKALGTKARAAVQAMQGALARTLDAAEHLLLHARA